MHITVTVHHEGDESSDMARVTAKLRELQIEERPGGCGGAQWFYLTGEIDQAGLQAVIDAFSN